MSLALFTYCLPALLGYILFVGISGRFAPLSRPSRLVDRPSWALGLWVGLAVSLVMTVGLRMAYTTPPEDVRALLAPSAWALSALLLPGLIVWLVYRGGIARALDAEAVSRRRSSFESARILAFPARDEADVFGETAPPSPTGETDGESGDGMTDDVPARHEAAAEGDAPTREPVRAEAEASPVVATFLDIGGPERLDIPDIPVAGQLTPAAAIAAAVADAVDRDAHEAAIGAAENELGTLCLALQEEERRREEAETHLRVTRGALARLEAESRDHEGDKADVLIALEEELESRIRESVTAESRATRERARRIEVETTVLALKQDLLAARSKARRGTESKAKAISTATRSVALARQAVKARARIERRLGEAEAALANRDATVSSLIAALEKEKNRTQEQVAALAKQLVLHEKQLHARRNLEEVARSVEGKLATRLARKVARARPVVSSD